VTELRGKRLAKILQVVPVLLGMPERRMSVDYDEEADVLYVAFERPERDGQRNARRRCDRPQARKEGRRRHDLGRMGAVNSTVDTTVAQGAIALERCDEPDRGQVQRS